MSISNQNKVNLESQYFANLTPILSRVFETQENRLSSSSVCQIIYTTLLMGRVDVLSCRNMSSQKKIITIGSNMNSMILIS